MNGNTIRCGLDGCTSQQCASLDNHVWKEEFAVYGCAPHSIPTQTKYMAVWVDIDGRQRRPDELMISVYNDVNYEDGAEAWVTVEEAEKIVAVLTSAIRRHTAYRETGR